MEMIRPAAVKRGARVRGTCRCHAVTVTGTAGPVSAPRPVTMTDFWTGKRVRVWYVLDDNGSNHDVPVDGLRVID